MINGRESSMIRKTVLKIIICVMGIFAAMPAAHANPKYASFVMDADTGMVLHQRHANKKLHPASLTKVMTLIMLFDAMESGKIRPSDRIYISNHAASMVPSKLGLEPGSSIRVSDAIPALIIKSANDIAAAVAENIGGTESNFARMMTRRARQIGMYDTVFVNASGLHNPKQISTARDMAKMAHYVIKNYPEHYRLFQQKEFTYAGKTYRSHNRLMNSFAGMDGMKTGYVNASGFNLISSATRNNRRVIGVVFGGRTSQTRNAHMATLLDRSFAQLAPVRMASATIPVPSQKPFSAIQMASLNAVNPAAGNASVSTAPQLAPAPKPTDSLKWASFNAGNFIIDQGDADPAMEQRIRAGLITAAALSGDHDPSLMDTAKGWAIQIGAFRSKTQSKNALKTALSQLPNYYTKAQPMIVPLKTAKRQIYRARLSGYSSQDAYAACAYIQECITIAP